MTKLTTYYNPINALERLVNEQFNLMPVFHNLEDIYRTGDTVRFNSTETHMNVEIDLPGVIKEDTEMKVDSDEREIYIKAKRTVQDQQGKKTFTLNRSFTVGKDYQLENITASQKDGVLTITIPKNKKTPVKLIQIT
jgi:HSP20 family protein